MSPARCCALQMAPARLAGDSQPYAVPRQTGGEISGILRVLQRKQWAVPSSTSAWSLALLKHLERHARCIHGSGPAGIERQMGNESVNFVFRDAILQRPPDMPPQFIRPVEGSQSSHGNQ